MAEKVRKVAVMGRISGVQQSNFEGEGEREEHFLLLKMLITTYQWISTLVQKRLGEYHKQTASAARLSLRGGGQGFLPASRNFAPGHFQRKIEENRTKRNPGCLIPPYPYLLYLP